MVTGRSILTNFKEAITSNPPPQRPLPFGWLKPPNGYFKVNVDGAYANDDSHSSVGVIIRDDKGHPIATLSKVL